MTTAGQKKPEKLRLDQLLVDRGIAPTREKAQAMVLAGLVLVNDAPAEKAGLKFPDNVDIRLKGEPSPFVGRGGEKLEGALLDFQIIVNNVIALDVGASTGGFTDCLLQRGAQKVYSVDVGFNQLDEKLRRDTRVVSMEKTHVKDLSLEMFQPPPNFVVADVSFISVRRVLDAVTDFLAPGSKLLILVKPQFELGRESVSKGGVVKGEELQREAVRLVEEHARSLGLKSHGSSPSRLRGGKKGNQEYFLHLEKESTGGPK